MHREAVQLIGWDPPHLQGLAARCRGSADRSSREHHGALLAYLAVARVEDHVPWVRTDPDQAGDLAVDAALFLGLADGSVRDALSWVHCAARQRPVVVIRPPDQEEPVLVVDDSNVDRRDETVRRRRLR